MVNILLPVSRSDWLRPVFECLHNLKRPDDTELLIITDGDKDLEHAVDKRLDNLNYSKVRVVSFGDKPESDKNKRRFRIAEIHNFAKTLIPDKCDYVMLLEDDTICPADTLEKLLKDIKQVPNTAFVEGVELGRWNAPYVGAWQIDDIENPQQISSVRVNAGLRRIDAGGFYCALVEAELYKMHHFEPFDKLGTNGLSCDVNFGLYLRQQGYKCLIDWNIQCDHIGDRGSVNLGNATPCQVIFTKHKDKWVSERVQ